MDKFYCPVNGWDCPYWRKDGTCSMADDGDGDPREECDDAAAMEEFFEADSIIMITFGG
jgi:hypothetical protein